MVRSNLTRRDFNKLAAAALGGVVTGTLVGCGDKTGSDGKSGSDGNGDSDAPETGLSLLFNETNVCRGLNACKANGKGTHDCAGQGACHGLAADQSCGGKNECKGQGGCKETAGINSCKGKGECAVPLNDDAWAATRKLFEAEWNKKNPDKELGAAPAKPPA